MKLYGFPASPNTWKVRALASHLKMPLDFEFVDLLQGAQQTPAYLELNPTGRTPVLVDGDFKLWESNAILQYLASKSATPLYPSDAKSRADVTRWLCWDLAHWGAQACQPLIFENLVKKFVDLGPPDAAVVAKASEAFNKEAKMLDAHLARHKFLVNDMLTVADFAVAAPLFHAQGAAIPLSPYGHLRSWFERVSSLPCWNETAPQMRQAA
ncbi:MAG TPA: glutathione S-transferase family protein [Xanthobacteraceae bacterium]|jgi:glutathione S-transferase|nr:glutathione S-transferase family protein [Xanthobacteraceae bacterium]